jgi:hypothetical protein
MGWVLNGGLIVAQRMRSLSLLWTNPEQEWDCVRTFSRPGKA